jgi:dihydropteroate synthase
LVEYLGITRCGNTEFRWGERTYVMGIVNVSPDSFSGDGLRDIDSAVAQARQMEEEGADILDVGGESTRPGSSSITVEEELKRVIPVVEKVHAAVKLPVSIDSYKWEVAIKALEAGASILNDQWGLKKEPRLGELAAKFGAPIILMSNQRDKGGFDANVQRDGSEYSNVMSEVISSQKRSIEMALSVGVSPNNIILDPGIGFGKTWQQEIEIVRRLRELKSLGYPVLIGPSRKSLIKMVLNLPANDRVEGTAAVVALSIANGADIVRVHDVKQMVRVCRMSDAIVRDI